MYKTLFVVLFALLINTAQSATNSIDKDFINWEKDFIPALFHSGHAKQDKLKQDLLTLNSNWVSFSKNHSDANAGDEGWKADFKKISQILTALDSSDAHKVHLELEKIRDLLIDMRDRNGMAYYLDRVYGFHDAMEDVIHYLKKHPKIKRKRWAKAQELGRSLEKQMAALLTKEFDEEAYGFDESTMEKLELYIESLKAGTKSFNKALNDKDAALSLKKAKSIKKEYIKLYLLFGRKESGGK